MMIPSIDDARNLSQRQFDINTENWKNVVISRVALAISAATTKGEFRCKVDFTDLVQDNAFHEALSLIGNDMERDGYEVLYTTSGDEAEDSLICENIRISWY